MNHPLTSRAVALGRNTLLEESLIVLITVSVTAAALASPLALPLVVSGVVFILAALRFKPLLLMVVFFLPVTPFLSWDFPIKDLSTLVRFSLFAGVLVYRASHHERLGRWLWGGWLSRGMLGYFLVAAVSVLVHPLTLEAERELMRLASYVCFYYVITDWVECQETQHQEDVAALFKVLMYSTIAVATFGFYQALSGGYSQLYELLYPVQDAILQIPPWEGRITSVLEHFNGLAGYLNLIIPFCIAFALRGGERGLRILSWWCFALSSVALLLTQSRGGLLAYAAILVASACFFAPNRKARTRRIALVVVACVLLGAVAGLFFQRLAAIDDFTAVSRLAIWGGAFTVFTGSPVIGMGFGNFRTFLGGLLGLPEGWVGDAHNLYLELLAETGAAGFLVFAFWMFCALRLARRRRRENDGLESMVGIATIAALVGVLVHGTVDYLFHTTPQVTALFFLVMAVLGSYRSTTAVAAQQTARQPGTGESC